MALNKNVYKCNSYVFFMTKKELSQSDNDLAEEIAHGIYIWDSPILLFICYSIAYFILYLTAIWYFNLSDNGRSIILYLCIIGVVISLVMDYYISNNQVNYIEHLCKVLLIHNISPSRLKTNTKYHTIYNLENKLEENNLLQENLILKNSSESMKKIKDTTILVLVIAGFTLGSLYSIPTSSQSIQSTIDIDEVKNNAIENFDYRAIMRNPENYINQPIKFSGKIVQAQESRNNRFIFRISTRQDSFLDEDIIWGNFQGQRFLENDYVEGYAVIRGLRTYEAILGNQMTIPEVDIVEMNLIR